MGLTMDVAAGEGGAPWPPPDFIAAYVFNAPAFCKERNQDMNDNKLNSYSFS
jgi:hypothetical protein